MRLNNFLNKNKRIIIVTIIFLFFCIILFIFLTPDNQTKRIFFGNYFVFEVLENKKDYTPMLIFITLIVGILAILGKRINNFLFPPKFEIKIKKIDNFERTNGSISDYFNINIKNIGYSMAKNIRVKVRDGDVDEWVSLVTPLSSAQKSIYRNTERIICIKKLSKDEEDNFSFGRISKKDTPYNWSNDISRGRILAETFVLMSDIDPRNQKTKISKGDDCIYFIQIVGDNFEIINKKISVENHGFDNCIVKEVNI